MCKKNVILSFILFFITLLSANAPDTLWTKIYGGNGNDYAMSIINIDSTGSLICGSTAPSNSNNSDVYLLRINKYGDTLWTKQIEDTLREFGKFIMEANDSGYLIAALAGNLSGLPKAHIWLIRINSFGDTLWTKNISKNYYDNITSIYRENKDGYIILANSSFPSPQGYDLWLIKIDNDGDTLWSKTYGGDGAEFAGAAIQTKDNGYLITGSTFVNDTAEGDVWIIKTDSFGETLWSRIYGGKQKEGGRQIQMLKDGGYIIGCRYYSPYEGNSDILLMKIDDDGDTLWNKVYGGTEDDWIMSMLATKDGGCIGVGYTKSNNDRDTNVWVIKINESGDTLWTKEIGGKKGDIGRSIQETSDGGYIICGTTKSFDGKQEDIYIIRLDKESTDIKKKNDGKSLRENGLNLSTK
jgi:hypothetical protein